MQWDEDNNLLDEDNNTILIIIYYSEMTTLRNIDGSHVTYFIQSMTLPHFSPRRQSNFFFLIRKYIELENCNIFDSQISQNGIKWNHDHQPFFQHMKENYTYWCHEFKCQVWILSKHISSQVKILMRKNKKPWASSHLHVYKTFISNIK